MLLGGATGAKIFTGKILCYLLNIRGNLDTIIVIWAKALWITAGGKNFPSFFLESNMRELNKLAMGNMFGGVIV